MKPISLSKTEQKLFDCFPRGGIKISTTEMVNRMYPDEASRPFHARSTVLTRATVLARKLESMDSEFRLRKSEQAGPKPIYYWIERVG